jgi:hypothetical protein
MLTTLRASANYVKQSAWHIKHKGSGQGNLYQNQYAETEFSGACMFQGE